MICFFYKLGVMCEKGGGYAMKTLWLPISLFIGGAALGFLLDGPYKLHRTDSTVVVWRINSITGSIELCRYLRDHVRCVAEARIAENPVSSSESSGTTYTTEELFGKSQN